MLNKKRFNLPALANYYLSGLALLALVGLMSVHHLTGACLVLLLIPSLYMLKRNWQELHGVVPTMLIVSMLLPVTAIFVSQLARWDWLGHAYDGPSRILFCLPVMLYFASQNINFSKLLGIAAPLTLLTAALSIYLHPEVMEHWAGRYATTYVDPNSFGNLTVLFTAFCLLQINPRLNDSKAWIGYQFFGLLVGVYLILGSGTRGSWFSIPFILGIWLAFNYQKLNIKFISLFSVVLLLAYLFILFIFPNVSDRLFGGFHEVSLWSHNQGSETSAGIRLNMWGIAWDLFLHHPWLGYGDMGFVRYLHAPWISADTSQTAIETITCCGPHNELLANTLRSGILGILSVLGVFLLPLLFFIRHLRQAQPAVKLAAQTGIIYIVTLMISSISMEVFNLKYTSSLYAILIAGLAGQIIASLSTQQSSSHAQ
jgi:O-antigen ligase